MRKLSDFESTPIAGTEGGQSPFFSPNGEWLAFVEDNKLKKVLLRGGSAVLVTGDAALSGAWADDDTIYFPKTFFSALHAVSAGGGRRDR